MAQAIYYDGTWYDENIRLTGPMDHAFWMATVVFDGARAFGGLAPDLMAHCERLIDSAGRMGLAAVKSAAEVHALSIEGIRRFPAQAELYIRPMFFAREGFVIPEPESTDFVLAIYDSPMPSYQGFTVCLSRYRRPARDQAPTDAKASCLYPNSQRMLREATARGFDNAIVLDANGNVAEYATSNLWIAKDGVAMTPAVNGTFLNGVTRRRVIGLLRDSGVEVRECVLTFDDVMAADEVFSTGNYGKVLPVTRVEARDLQPGPVCQKARELYFDFAESARVL